MTSDAPRALCPVCGRLYDKGTVHDQRDVITATYVCPREHLWVTRWTVPKRAVS